MIVLKNDPFALIISIVKQKYPELDAEVYFVDNVPEKAYGAALIPDEGTEHKGPFEIVISSGIPIFGAVEVLAHELAHTIVGGKCADDHGPEWKEVFDWINQEFIKEMGVIAEQDKKFDFSTIEKEVKEEKPELKITLSKLIDKLIKLQKRYPDYDPELHVLRPEDDFEHDNDFFPVSDVDVVDGGEDESGKHYEIPVLLVNNSKATEINWSET